MSLSNCPEVLVKSFQYLPGLSTHTPSFLASSLTLLEKQFVNKDEHTSRFLIVTIKKLKHITVSFLKKDIYSIKELLRTKNM
jgi:hypothetical protein